MRFRITLVLFVLLSMPWMHAQEYHWKVGLDYFFDNREYKASSYDIPRTLNGIWLNTLGGVVWEKRHAIYGGVNLLKIPGSGETIDDTDLSLYYQYKRPKMIFLAGLFPRQEVLSNYSDFFFSDSVNYFRPLTQGIFWQIGESDRFFNAWMDWTGHATEDTRESFFLGFSGKMSGKVFFADFESYLFHYAGTLPSNPAYGVSEQMQGIVSLGVRRQDSQGFSGSLSAGLFAGFERDRKEGDHYAPLGLAARADAEWHGIGTRNSLYWGDARMRLFPAHGSNLYWGNPFLRGKIYLQSKWYVRIMDSDHVSARLNCNLHFTEGKVLFQQTLTVSAVIGNFLSGDNRPVNYPWMNIFK